MKKEGGEEIKGFVWYALRIGFWLMIGAWFGSTMISYALLYDLIILPALMAWIYFGLLIFTFVLSIIHLTKHKSKVLAIVGLVISIILILGFVYGLIVGMLTPVCPEGFVLGEDYECHEECNGAYCLAGSCCNKECIRCEEGAYLASDCKCYAYPEE